MLAPDVNATEQSLNGFSTVMNTVGTYCVYIVLAETGPVDVLGTNVDILANCPGVKAAIAGAKAHAMTFVEANVASSVLQSVANYDSQFQSTSGELLSTLDAVDVSPDGQPTPAQQQSLASGMKTLLSELTTQQSAVHAQVALTKTFADQLTNDHASLAGGENSISNAITTVNNWVYSAGEAAMGGPGGAAAADSIAEVGSTVIASLNKFLIDVETLVAQNASASTALSSVLTIWNTLIQKYADVISNMQAADGGGILAAGDVRSAQAAWTELSNYVQTLMHP